MPDAGVELQGTVIGGKYRLGRYLGSSERSAVFLTERKQENPQNAAIKLIPTPPGGADAELSRLKLIAKLSHPHLLQIFEVGRCEHQGGDLLYVVMEYADETLEQILGIRSLTEQETDEMLKPMLEALAFLHKRGFVHGHITPPNILVAGEQLKLASDGICKIGEPGDGAGGTDVSPEHREKAIAASSDIWQLGVTTVQALTQLLPVREGENQPPTIPESLPPSFAELARNCLDPDPQRRCTLEEIAGRLQYKLQAPKELPVPARPAVVERRVVAMPERSVSARQSNKATVRPMPATRMPTPRPPAALGRYATSAFVLVLVVAGAVGGVKLLNHRLSQQQQIAQAAPQQMDASSTAPVGEPIPPRSENKADARPSKEKSAARASLKTASEVRNVYSVSPIESSTPPTVIDSAPGKVVRQVLPEVSQSAMKTIHGTIRVAVRVHVDPAGNILGVSFIAAGPSQYFARLASDAAQQWKFAPPHRNGKAVASAWDLRFEFIRGATRVNPVLIP